MKVDKLGDLSRSQRKSEYIDEARYKALDRKCSTIRFLLVKSITTAKNNLKEERKKKNSIQCDPS